ncbi:NAD(P)H-hydrate dehydratase [Fervidicoccus fontis]|uniref:Bifunctional NAD(P)H-hydrate repair enzyme n=1 Tax=Fervidicoccus fontis TaxID=683846 RepID=A0A2J6N3G0_9CREN|nr:NAD(P)H-hydrate dehydratase [Fervidicoccus fontis]MBE9390499.1 NAD(P)H-hydrate dehydratase [Fervidicoccus fontis]PMB75872.1 MAG: bifunctional ADP-dependent NAD(P)H-hydrate dehydratase/NAD(P)H-hydrate epimerase [Fervidicoccus fontis]PMB77751.1 MAG: bifunctional ADP-dependent NAD(P)H-hydrate dehydratase/NAD(P)H-hydrate epimerase [Fervidicoccus fontis]HEW64293.1 NAD(P)H-hydrate dehydratase [Fervidicoccus fontis]
MLGDCLSSKRIRAIEENMTYLGIPTLLLMENAGKCVAEESYKALETLGKENGKVVVVAGRGGNAGDGFVAARHLRAMGVSVDVLLLYQKELINHNDARTNLDYLLKDFQINIFHWDEISPHSFLKNYDIIIDAILGTGVRGELRYPIPQAIEAINSSGSYVVAVDIPSGIDPDTGDLASYRDEKIAVKANTTVVMHYRKKGLENRGEFAGKQVICDVGITPAAEKIVGPGDVRNFLKLKPKDAKKGDGGIVTVIGGSKEYYGAPTLSALAVLRAGADLVYLIVPEKIKQIVSSFTPSLIVIGTENDYHSPEEISSIDKYISRSDSVVVGPGLGFNETTCNFVSELIDHLKSKYPDAKVIVDADALKCIAKNKKTLNENFVLTPHRGELDLLLRSYDITGDNDREKNSLNLSNKLGGAIVVSKGPIDYICSAKYGCREKRCGNPGMSIGGTGDILTGLIAAFYKRTGSLFYASCIASFVNSLAGDYLLNNYNEFYTSEDVLNCISTVLRDLFNKKK